MVQSENQLKNLKPIQDTERAKMLGRMGGLKTSLRKKIALSLNRATTGERIKVPEVIEQLVPKTIEEAKMGWTFERKLQIAKENSPIAGARNAIEAIGAWSIELTELKASMVRWEQDKLKIGIVPSPHFREKYMQRVEEFEKNVWGLTPQNNMVFIQQNNQVQNIVNMDELLIKALAKKVKNVEPTIESI